MTAPAPHAAPPRSSFWQKLGPGGLSSLLLALAGGLLALGIPVARCIRRVLAEAEGGGDGRADAILVLGRRLVSDQPTAVFRSRLDHAAALWRRGIAPCVIVTGGITGSAARSEAAAGREWLLHQGLPAAAVLTEDRSQHTLENLFNVREMARQRGWSGLVMVSDPLHLARAKAMAEGLGLAVSGSPAADAPPRRGSAAWWLRAVREGFLLHWYRTGMRYSRLIRSEKQLSRVT